MTEETLLDSSKLEKIIMKSKMEKPVIILGVMHSNEDEYNCYKYLVKKFEPCYVLCENNYDAENEKEECFPEVNEWKKECKIDLVLCDLTHIDQIKKKHIILKNMFSKKYSDSDYPFTETFFEDCNMSSPELCLERLFYNEREKRMGETILKCLEKNEKPIIVIIGHEHAGECSNIHNVLNKTDYIAFWKSNKYCRNCGTKLNREDKEKICNICKKDLYNLICSKSCK